MDNRVKPAKVENHSTVKVVLTTLYISCLIVSNIIAGRQVALPFNLVMPSAVILFPITYILSDVFSEVYGYKWSRKTNHLGITMNLLAVIVFAIAINAPAPSYFEGAEAYKAVLGNTPRMLLASTLGLYVGDLLNDITFRKMKAKHKDSHQRYGARAIISSVVGQLGDSLIFIPLAFYGTMPITTMFTMTVTQATFKVMYEIVILPLSYKVVHSLSAYEKRVALSK